MRKLTLSLAVMAALLPSHVLPLGLGEIELNSALNQELDAEIKVLSAAPEDAEQLIVKLASREAFARAGIDRPFSLQDLKFKTILKGDVPYIKVYTTESVREPFLSFLVEIDWPNGHLLREYTLLLDPPVFNTGAGDQRFLDEGGTDQAFFEPADVSAEPAATTTSPFDEEVVADADFDPAQPVQHFNAVPDNAAAEEAMPVIPQTAQQPARSAPQYSQQVSGQYRVQENDTLWSLAEKLRPNADVSIEQMMLALVQENPESFIKENINGVKRGYILRMPERATITAIDRQTALEQVRQHNALWREYRQTLSASVPASAMEAEDTGIDRKETTTDGRLNIVSAADGQPGSEASLAGQDPKSQVAQLKRDLSVARESLESERLEKENLRQRLAELEARVQHVIDQGAIPMDDPELARLQADLAGTQKQADKLAQPAVTTPGGSPIAGEIEPPKPVEPETPAPMDAETASGEPPLFVDETPPEQGDMAGAEPAMDAEPAEPVAPAAPPQAATAPQPGLLQGLLANPLALPVVGGVAVLLLAIVALILRRRRAARAEEDSSKWADMDQPINFDDAVESVGEPYIKIKNRDDDATAEMHVTDTVQKQEEMHDTVVGLPDETAEAEQRDDVLAEADVYLAYGIYQQAEDLLLNALRQHPDRDDYRMKLLETHFASKNASAFTELAKEAKQRKGSVKSYWDRVIVMGRELCPDVAMFREGAALLPGFDADDLLPQKPQTTDFELDVGGMAPDLDIGFTENKAPPAKKADDDLDFSLDTDATMVLKEPVKIAPPEPELDLAADLENIANAMDLASTSTTKPKAAMSADLDLGDLGDLDFSADSLSLDSDMSSGGGIDDDFALDFEASDLGLATDTDESTGMDTSLDLAMDDMDMSMDIESAPEPARPAARPAMNLDAGGDDDFDISQLSEDVDEVTTKLDLARAYMDMGDNEGARNILEEVKSEGNPAQKKQAEELMAKAS